ncbi:MAG TPA: flagellar motor stator protein MotA [Planctomycetaceae bacterium]|jgi:chemotaxis protein MotA|nr:flagellar motor stator protein MotA [Planctomycetaceae bacterium]
MVVVAGIAVVLGCVLAGFTMSGGHIGALMHPSELVTIGGAALGAMIMMSPIKVLKDLAKALLTMLKGSPYDKASYRELFKLMYDLLRIARRDGLLMLERHVSDPHHSEVINRYPRIAGNHHVMEFICNGLSPLVDGATPEQVSGLLQAEMRILEEEHHAPINVLSKTADALPGFGIVAAVLGIVITMGAIDGPVQEVGHKVGAALVGTFLGILLSYGCFGPLASRLEFMGAVELGFFRAISSIVMGAAQSQSPKVVIEQARRGIGTEFRPTRTEMEELFKEVDAT